MSEEKECTVGKNNKCEFKNCYGHYLTKKYSHCEYVSDKHCPYELTKQLQTAKEENEKLKEENKLFKNTIKKFNLDWYEEKLVSLTQQNKQMREALEKIITYDIGNNSYKVANIVGIAQQALGGE